MNSKQPNFEIVKTAFYRMFENDNNVNIMVLREQIQSKILLPVYHSRKAVFLKDLNNWLDTIDIRQVTVLIDILKERNASLPIWIKDKSFSIEYNSYNFLDLCKNI